MILVVTCQTCGHRQRQERRCTEPEIRKVVCHGCESVIEVKVTAHDLVHPTQPQQVTR